MGALGERHIGEVGTPEALWSRWLSSRRFPTVALDGLLPATARLVVVSPHPDDEVLACGGLLAAHAARGGRCLVVAVTDGEASHPQCPHWTPHDLALARRAERQDGLRHLGVSSDRVVRLALGDGRVEACRPSLHEALAKLLRPGDLVVTTWRLDGHPDHEACGAVMADLAERAPVRWLEAPVWMWHWSSPDDRHVPWGSLRRFALDEDLVRRKRSALLAHATQLTPRDAFTGPVLGSLMLERASRNAEYFFLPP